MDPQAPTPVRAGGQEMRGRAAGPQRHRNYPETPEVCAILETGSHHGLTSGRQVGQVGAEQQGHSPQKGKCGLTSAWAFPRPGQARPGGILANSSGRPACKYTIEGFRERQGYTFPGPRQRQPVQPERSHGPRFQAFPTTLPCPCGPTSVTADPPGYAQSSRPLQKHPQAAG